MLEIVNAYNWHSKLKQGEDQEITIDIENRDEFYQHQGDLSFKLYRYTTGSNNSSRTLIGVCVNGSGVAIGNSVQVDDAFVDTYYNLFVVPSDLTPGTYYGVEVTLEGNSYTGTDVFNTRQFEVIDSTTQLSDCDLTIFNFAHDNLSSICDISGLAVTTTVLYGSSISSVACYWQISTGATLSVGGVDKSTGDSLNLSAPLDVKITAEDGTNKTYTVTVSVSDAPPAGSLKFYTYSNESSVSPNPVGMGEVVHIVFSCMNDNTEDYPADGGAVIAVTFNYGGEIIFMTNIALTKAIPALGRIIFKKDVIVPTDLEVFGTNYTVTFEATHSAFSPISKTLKISNIINSTKTKVFSEKESLFVGQRSSYKSPAFFAVNKDLYGCREESYTEKNKFYLMDSNLETYLWDSINPGKWSITFIVMVGVDPVIFKTLDIELGLVSGGQVELSSIEFATNRQSSTLNPFYSSEDTEWSPWNPVYKDEKWHLPVKNEYQEDELIPYRKMKGTYLRLVLTGRNIDQVVLRNVVTKILKISN